MNLLFELQNFEGEGKDYTAKTANVEKKKKSWFIYLLERKGTTDFKLQSLPKAKFNTVQP